VGVIHEKLPSVITARLDRVLDYGRARSIWPMSFAIACCGIEMMTTGSPRYDGDRFGIFFRATPRQSDLLIVAGPVSRKMEPAIKRIYDEMAAPRWVVAMGSCAISGGAFVDSYNILKGVDTILPVDIYIPGCPPRPEAFFDGILKLKERVSAGLTETQRQRLTRDEPIVVQPTAADERRDPDADAG